MQSELQNSLELTLQTKNLFERTKSWKNFIKFIINDGNSHGYFKIRQQLIQRSKHVFPPSPHVNS